MMPDNESSSADGRSSQNLRKQTSIDDTLKSERVQIDRKKIVCTLKRNRRGCFLRVSEESGCHQNTIIIPGAGLRMMRRILDDMLKLTDESSEA